MSSWADICDIRASKQCLYDGEKYQTDKIYFLGKRKLLVLRTWVAVAGTENFWGVLCFITADIFLYLISVEPFISFSFQRSHQEKALQCTSIFDCTYHITCCIIIYFCNLFYRCLVCSMFYSFIKPLLFFLSFFFSSFLLFLSFLFFACLLSFFYNYNIPN